MDKRVGPLPFVIGVTGHRDLRPEDIASLKKSVGEIIDEFRERIPHTPMIVLSALAEGADRLVAKVALEKNVRVVVPMPMTKSFYEQDFGPPSLEEFRSLIEQIGAANIFELPLVEGSTEKDILAGEKRDIQYAQLGQYIVLHSHLVLALWDGLDPSLLGGTADVVKMCLKEGRMEELTSGSSWLNYEDECGPVYQVLTPRSETHLSVPLNLMQLVMGPDTVPAQKKIIYPKGTEQTFGARWRCTERFNKDYLWKHKFIMGARSSSLKVFETTDSYELKRSVELANVFVAADQLALRWKRTWEKTIMVLQVLIILSICCFAAVNDLKPLLRSYIAHWTPMMWSLFVGFTSMAFSVWGFASWRQFQNRFLDYRGLAEALRIQFNWNVAGIHDIEVVDCYLRHQLDKLTWIRTAIRVCCLGRVPTSPKNKEYQLRSVFENWVKEQSEYYDQATPKRDERSRRMTSWELVLVMLALGCTVIMMLHSIGWVSLGSFSGLIKMLAKVMVGSAAVMVGYVKILAIEEESRQFGRMRTIYNRANKFRTRFLPGTMGATVDLTNACKIIRELGKESLEENGDWIVMHRARPLEVPLSKTEISVIKKSIGIMKAKKKSSNNHG